MLLSFKGKATANRVRKIIYDSLRNSDIKISGLSKLKIPGTVKYQGQQYFINTKSSERLIKEVKSTIIDLTKERYDRRWAKDTNKLISLKIEIKTVPEMSYQLKKNGMSNIGFSNGNGIQFSIDIEYEDNNGKINKDSTSEMTYGVWITIPTEKFK